MVIPVANLSTVVTGAAHAAMGFAAEMLPTEASRDAMFEAARTWVAWLLRHLRAWLVAARAGAVDNLPAAAEAAKRTAGSAAEASGWLAAASATANGAVWALVGAVFVCGAVWALTCRTMKAPGLGGARIPRAMFKANPKRYYAAVRTARKARRGASGAQWKLLVAAPVVACAAYVVAKALY